MRSMKVRKGEIGSPKEGSLAAPNLQEGQQWTISERLREGQGRGRFVKGMGTRRQELMATPIRRILLACQWL